MPNNSDVVLIISQYIKCLEKFKYDNVKQLSGNTRHTNNGEEQQYYCRNHHEPIISHEIFELAEQETRRRADEKNIKKSTQKYNKRYAFSGIIKCGECGAIMKRRTHYTGRKEYIAWTCGTHLEDKTKCPMLYVRDDAIKAALPR